MAQNKYELKNGEIFREGVKIATREEQTGTITYQPDCDRYRAPVSAWLKELGMDKPPVVPPEVAAKQARPTFVGSNLAAADTPPPPAEPVTTTTNGGPTPEQKRIAELEAQLAVLKGEKPSQPPPPKPKAKPVDARFVSKDEQTGHVRPSVGDALLDPLKLRTYPDAPKYGTAGDKTPAFVDWLWANHPEDAAVRYLNRKLPGTPFDERLAAARAAGANV